MARWWPTWLLVGCLCWLVLCVRWWSESALLRLEDRGADVVAKLVGVAGHGAADVADDRPVVAGEHGCAVAVTGCADESAVQQGVATGAEPDEVVHGGRSTVEPGHQVVHFEVAVVAPRSGAAMLVGGEHS